MKLNHLIAAGIALLPLAINAAPAPNKIDRKDGLLRQELSQERIGQSLARVARQLEAVIAEYDRNGLEGDDVKTLRKFHGMLGKLSKGDVQKIVGQLKAARIIPANETANNASAFGAFAGQKTVIIQLNQIYLDWQNQQIFRQLSERYKRLAGSQKSNEERTVSMAKNYNKIRYSTSTTIDLRIQKLDQVGIGEEADALAKKLEELAEDYKEVAEETRPKLALAKAKTDLKTALDGALADFESPTPRLNSAAGNERRARIAMIEIAKILAPKRDKEEIIRQAIRDIEQTMTKQEEVIKETKEITK